MWFVRRAGLAALAAVVGLSLASAASGSAATGSNASSAGRSANAAPPQSPVTPHKKPSPKRKKHRRHGTPRSAGAGSATSRLNFAASTEMMSGRSHDGLGALVDEARLPPPVPNGKCPPEMASIDHRYCVDRWEGSLVERSPAGDRPFSPFLVVDGHDVRAASVPNVFPQGYISGAQAQVACERAGKRLCSPNEWRKACVGPDVQLYGYAESRERGACNDAGRSPMLALWGGAGGANLSAASNWDPLKMNDPRLNQLDGSLSRTGAHASCTNDYGVYDMVGNLHEWTSDPGGTFQGGYYLDTSINGEGCTYRTTAHDFGYHDYSTGFRCCADPR